MAATVVHSNCLSRHDFITTYIIFQQVQLCSHIFYYLHKLNFVSKTVCSTNSILLVAFDVYRRSEFLTMWTEFDVGFDLGVCYVSNRKVVVDSLPPYSCYSQFVEVLFALSKSFLIYPVWSALRINKKT